MRSSPIAGIPCRRPEGQRAIPLQPTRRFADASNLRSKGEFADHDLAESVARGVAQEAHCLDDVGLDGTAVPSVRAIEPFLDETWTAFRSAIALERAWRTHAIPIRTNVGGKHGYINRWTLVPSAI